MADERQNREALPGGGLSRRTLLKRAAGAGAALVAVIGGRARGEEAGPMVKVVPEVDLKSSIRCGPPR